MTKLRKSRWRLKSSSLHLVGVALGTWLLAFSAELRAQAPDSLNVNIMAGVVVNTAVVQPDGKILIGGNFNNVLGVPRNNFARLNADGTLDMAFDPNVCGGVLAVALQPDGKILIGGDFLCVGGQQIKYLARLDSTGAVESAFNPDPQAEIYSLVVQSDGKILVGGSFESISNANSIGGQPRNNIARLEANGLADSFNPNASGVVSTIAVQSDGKILAGGSFGFVAGFAQTRHGIARFDPMTGAADSFNPDAGSSHSVNVIAIQPDGKILVAGGFLSIGGQNRSGFARLDPATGLADSFNPSPNQSVVSIAIQGDGKIFAGGGFTNIGGQQRNYLARIDPTTGQADSFDATITGSGGFMYAVYSAGLQADGKLLITGDFTSIGGQPRRFLARLTNDTAATQDLTISSDTVTWTRGGSSPHLARAGFEYSSDGTNYTYLADATANGSDWSLSNLTLPTGQNVYIRGRGYYRSGQNNGSQNITELVRNAFLTGSSAPGAVGNVSTRLPAGKDDNALIEGFIVQGPQGSAKKIVVRAIGPSLIPFGVAEALTNPTLEIHDSGGATVATNNDWKNTQVGGLITGDQSAEISGSGLAPSNDLESAIIANLAPGSYTAVVSGFGGTTGTGVVDAYDLSAASPAKLANIATRGLIQAGDKLMIAGFIVQNAPVKAVVRAIGPSLLAFGISNALPDTTLELHDENGAIILENDDWKTDPQQAQELQAIGLQPSHDLEAALITTIQPGQYTAQVRGKDNASGIGVVQVYFLQ
jgi:uncharacterized delta-60 repeat protein